MKIVSLLPSATEIVYALGLGDRLEAVTDECDYPPEAVTKPVASRSALPQGRPLSSRQIDAAVRERMDEAQPLYLLDEPLIQGVQPDVILTQDLCRVCAVPSGHVQLALEKLGVKDAKVLSLDPHSMEDILGTVSAVGDLLGVTERAAGLVAGLRERIEAVERTGLRLPTVRLFALEWLEPPFVAGHWIPDLVRIAGATNLLNEREKPSRTIAWHEIAEAAPEVVVFMPCGYYIEEAEEEARRLAANPDFAATPAARGGGVYAVDATSYFSRPGPRIVDGLEILAWAAHPESFPEPPSGRITRVGE